MGIVIETGERFINLVPQTDRGGDFPIPSSSSEDLYKLLQQQAERQRRVNLFKRTGISAGLPASQGCFFQTKVNSGQENEKVA